MIGFALGWLVGAAIASWIIGRSIRQADHEASKHDGGSLVCLRCGVEMEPIDEDLWGCGGCGLTSGVGA